MEKISQKIEYKDLRDIEKYILTYVCTHCGDNELMRTKIKTGKEIKDEWTMLVMSASLKAGRCQKCKYSTFSDCNMGGSINIIKAENNPDASIGVSSE